MLVLHIAVKATTAPGRAILEENNEEHGQW